MDGPEAVVTLPEATPERLAAAVRSALASQQELINAFVEGAKHTLAGETSNETARLFQTILELGYLVASADGFAEQERTSLSILLNHITESAVDPTTLELHFRDLDGAVALLGRRERLARTAAEITRPDQAERTLAAVATIALADGCLSAPEYTVLLELSEHLKLSPDDLSRIVDSARDRLEQGL